MYIRDKSKLWTLPLSIASIILVGSLSSLTLPAVAQQQPGQPTGQGYQCRGVEPGADVNTDLSQVPPPVLEAARQAAGDVQLTSYNSEKEDTGLVYEFQGVQANGCGLEVDVLESGQVDEIEREITPAELPQPVTATLNQKSPELAFSFIEESTRPDRQPSPVYEIEGKTAQGQAIELEIDAQGNIITQEQQEQAGQEGGQPGQAQ